MKNWLLRKTIQTERVRRVKANVMKSENYRTKHNEKTKETMGRVDALNCMIREDNERRNCSY
jgi:hypothetical protein